MFRKSLAEVQEEKTRGVIITKDLKSLNKTAAVQKANNVRSHY